MPTRRLTVIWCDFGGVLTPPICEAIRSMVEASGVPWQPMKRAIEVVAAELGVTGMAPLELGMLDQATWGARVTDLLAPGYVPAIDLRNWDEYWYRDREPNRGLLAELEELARRGVKIGMLTNSVQEWEVHRARMLRHFRPFDAVVRSHELGFGKPDPRIFAYAESKLPATDGSAVLIDDIERNCAAAQRHGWLAVRHASNADTIHRLRALVG